MSCRFQRIRSLLKLTTLVRNPLLPVLDRLGARTRPYRAVLWDGAVFELRPGRGDWPSVNGAYLWNEYAPVGKTLSPGDRVIDIGANIGAFTIRAARAVGPAGQVIAVEPARETFRQLQRNVELNHLTNAIAKHTAVGEAPGTATLHVAHNSVFTSLYRGVAGQAASIEEVTVVTLDQLLDENGWNRCDFLKLDCEGAEHAIVRGMSAATAAKIDQIGMELHDVEGFDSATLIDKLKTFGFSMLKRDGLLFCWRRE
ncbi:MAG: FkbM family methyltransferase [Thermoguttaceae bacterium]|jgi:FkbM family methyltransferase